MSSPRLTIGITTTERSRSYRPRPLRHPRTFSNLRYCN
ncbi:hypothetical protein CKA32_004816 [Geitlerinema sp. FC II]|nr:hypothetical protein CKA32_004816 [Geitlerinema sp. FC II]